MNQLDIFDRPDPVEPWTPPEGAQIAIAEGHAVMSEERLPDATDGQLAETYLDAFRSQGAVVSFGNPYAWQDAVGRELEARGYTHVCRNLAFASVFGAVEIRTNNAESRRSAVIAGIMQRS